MGSLFESDLVGSSFDVLGHVHGEAVTYDSTSTGGGPVAGTGIWSPFEQVPDAEIVGQEVLAGMLEVASAFVAAPNESHRVTVRGVVYGVLSFELTAIGWALKLRHLNQAIQGGDGTHLTATA